MSGLHLFQNKNKLLYPLVSSRQVTTFSIYGIIVACLFIGSSKFIATAGPVMLISYAYTSVLVLVVIRMPAEMAVSQPDTGSFSTYADRAIGRWAGFTIGWLYWWCWVLVIPVETITCENILSSWFSTVPDWLFSFGNVILLTITNLFIVESFGKFEFWFSIVKVAAIIAFMLLGALAVAGRLPTTPISGGDKFWSIDGFMAHGFGTVIGEVLVTVFSFFCAEIVSIAAADSRDPEEKIASATKLIVYRIELFYMIFISLVVAIAPWNDTRMLEVGPFQWTLEMMYIPRAKPIVDIVVVAICICLNSGFYTLSRVLFSLGLRGDAPASTCTTSNDGVLRVAVFSSTITGFLGCLANYLFPGQVFNILLSTTGAFGLVLYLVIAFIELHMRKQINMRGEIKKLKVWLFPLLTWFTIIVIFATLWCMFIAQAYRYEAFMTLGVTIFVLIASAIVSNKIKHALKSWVNNKVNFTFYLVN